MAWYETWPLERIRAHLGAGWGERIMSASNGLVWCQCRAIGAWDANQQDDYNAYRSLEKIMQSSMTKVS